MSNVTRPNTMGSAIYQPLDKDKRQIRLLELHPGDGDEPLICTLHVVSLPPRVGQPGYEKEMQKFVDWYCFEANELPHLPRALIAERALVYFTVLAYPDRLPENLKPEFQTHQRVLEFMVYYLRETQRLRFLDTLKACGGRSKTDHCSVTSYTHSDKQELKFTAQEAPWFIGYEAISYHWGDQTAKASILLNGQPFEAPLSSTEALRNLRWPQDTRMVWIDALCINQEDLAERGHQVAVMGNIYWYASRTLIWLGHEDEKTRPALMLLHYILKETSKDNTSAETINGKIQLVERGTGYAAKDLITAFFGRPWFTRVWVFQEVMLSQDSICHIGRRSISWQEVGSIAFTIPKLLSTTDFTSNMMIKEDIAMAFLLPLASGRPSSRSSHVPTPDEPPAEPRRLLDLILKTMTLKCSDPRDKIFGLLGLTTWAQSERTLLHQIEPSYTESIEICMRSATLAVIQEENSLTPLIFADDTMSRPREPEEEHWPSWAVHWHNLELKGGANLNHFRTYNAHRDNKVAIKILKNPAHPDALFARGFSVCTISYALPVFTPEMMRSSTLPMAFEQILGALFRHWETLSRLSVAEIFVATLLEGYFFRKQIQRNPPDKSKSSTCGNPDNGDSFIWQILDRAKSGDDLALFRRLSARLCSATEPGLKLRHDGRVMDVRSLGTIEQRRLFVTEDGHLGLGPGTLQEGDHVVVLFGSAMPFVLRPVDTWWNLRGYCYVDGIMDGELVAEREASGVKPGIFGLL